MTGIGGLAGGLHPLPPSMSPHKAPQYLVYRVPIFGDDEQRPNRNQEYETRAVRAKGRNDQR